MKVTDITPVRRGSVTLRDCDLELMRISGAIAAARAQYDSDQAKRLHEDADRWLDTRSELAAEAERLQGRPNA